jgi:HPt (histidine-containing phosphotransfer) domain-containing protein
MDPRTSRADTRSSDETDPGPPPGPTLDLEPLRALRDRTTPDGPLVERLLELFEAHAPERLEEMITSAATGDAERFRVAAHTLRSNAGIVGLVRLAAICQDGEVRAGRALQAGTDHDALVAELTPLAAAADAELRTGRAAIDEARRAGSFSGHDG